MSHLVDLVGEEVRFLIGLNEAGKPQARSAGPPVQQDFAPKTRLRWSERSGRRAPGFEVEF